MSDDTGRLWDTIRPFALHAGFTLVATIAIYGLTAALFIRWLRRFSVDATPMIARRIANPLFALTLLGIAGVTLGRPDKAIGTGLSHLIASSPWFHHKQVQEFTAGEFLSRAQWLGFNWTRRPQSPRSGTDAVPADLNVVLVLMESSYNKHLSLFGSKDETQPLLKQYRDRMELFPNFISNFPNSFHARFQVFNSLLAIKPYVSYINPRIEAPSIFEILHDHGYNTSFFYSSARDYTRMADYLSQRKLDRFYDCDNMPSSEKFRRVT